MPASFSDLIRVPTKDEMLDTFVALLRLAGFPVAAWQSDSFQRYTTETESDLLSDLSSGIQAVAKAGFIKYAAEVDDAWVDVAAEWFDETRKPAVFTRGTIRITDAASSGPHTVNPGAFWVANGDRSLRFVSANTSPVVIPLGSFADITFQAESPGSAYNVANDTLTEILTPPPGVTATNRDPGTGTWITQQGTDTEANAALVQRCLDKWSTLGSGSDDGAYRYHATTAAAEITRVKVYSPGAGAVRIIVAGASGPVSAAALAAAQSVIATKRPIGVPDVVVSNAVARVLNVSGTLFAESGKDLAALTASAQAAVDALARSYAIGGRVSRERIIRALLVDGLEDLELTSPGDTTLGIDEVFVPTYSLTATFA